MREYLENISAPVYPGWNVLRKFSSRILKLNFGHNYTILVKSVVYLKTLCHVTCVSYLGRDRSMMKGLLEDNPLCVGQCSGTLTNPHFN